MTPTVGVAPILSGFAVIIRELNDSSTDVVHGVAGVGIFDKFGQANQ